MFPLYYGEDFVEGLGFEILGLCVSGSRVQDLQLRVWDFMVQHLELRL